MVIRGGENIYPREIEEFLFTHPAVEQAAVVGVPDPKYGEELCAWIKLKAGSTATEDEIRDFCRAQAGPLQGAALRQVRRRVPADRDRQDSEVQDPRADEGRAGAGGAEDGVVLGGRGSCRAARLGRSLALPTIGIDYSPNFRWLVLSAVGKSPGTGSVTLPVAAHSVPRMERRDEADAFLRVVAVAHRRVEDAALAVVDA